MLCIIKHIGDFMEWRKNELLGFIISIAVFLPAMFSFFYFLRKETPEYSMYLSVVCCIAMIIGIMIGRYIDKKYKSGKKKSEENRYVL